MTTLAESHNRRLLKRNPKSPDIEIGNCLDYITEAIARHNPAFNQIFIVEVFVVLFCFGVCMVNNT